MSSEFFTTTIGKMRIPKVAIGDNADKMTRHAFVSSSSLQRSLRAMPQASMNDDEKKHVAVASKMTKYDSLL